MGKHIKLLCGLCLLLTLIRPMATLVHSGTEVFETVRNYWSSFTAEQGVSEEMKLRWEEEVLRMDASAAARTISLAMQQEFSLDASCLCVGVELTTDGSAISRVSVGLSGEGIWQDTHAIEMWLKELLHCETLIYLQ